MHKPVAELLCVVAVIALLTAVLAPIFQRIFHLGTFFSIAASVAATAIAAFVWYVWSQYTY